MERDILSLRRDEIIKEIGRLQDELAEIEAAERVLERYSGASWRSSRTSGELAPPRTPEGKPSNIPTVPAMILEVLREADRNGLKPREITERIARRWWPEIKGQHVSSVAWRLAKEGQLRKIGHAYSWPQSNRAVDQASDQDESTALVNPMHDRKAGQGGDA